MPGAWWECPLLGITATLFINTLSLPCSVDAIKALLLLFLESLSRLFWESSYPPGRGTLVPIASC